MNKIFGITCTVLLSKTLLQMTQL